eukprot:3701943-Heterocapsa_arctica.AAC.1
MNVRRAEGWLALVLLLEVLGTCLTHHLCELVLAVDDDAMLEGRTLRALNRRSLEAEARHSQCECIVKFAL